MTLISGDFLCKKVVINLMSTAITRLFNLLFLSGSVLLKKIGKILLERVQFL